MKKLTIQSPRFNGYVEVVYNSEQLVSIYFGNATLSPAGIDAMKKQIPVLQANLANSFGKDTTIVEVNYTVTLAEFTHEYPYQRNMHLLPPIWEKMLTADKITAVNEARKYRKYCNKNSEWYKPKIAAAWLKNKEYLNNWDKM